MICPPYYLWESFYFFFVHCPPGMSNLQVDAYLPNVFKVKMQAVLNEDLKRPA
jgi:hypothetical protein